MRGLTGAGDVGISDLTLRHLQLRPLTVEGRLALVILIAEGLVS
ncbi:MAG: hypothetical protein ACREOD_00125 [Candidatus Dormibacteria bacterium]